MGNWNCELIKNSICKGWGLICLYSPYLLFAAQLTTSGQPDKDTGYYAEGGGQDKGPLVALGLVKDESRNARSEGGSYSNTRLYDAINKSDAPSLKEVRGCGHEHGGCNSPTTAEEAYEGIGKAFPSQNLQKDKGT